MESLYFIGANAVEWRAAADPQLRGPDDALVRVIALLTTHQAKEPPGAPAYLRSLTDLPNMLRQLGIA